MDEQRAAQVPPNRLEHISRQMHSFIFSKIHTCKRTLHRVDQIRSLQFIKQCYSRCCSFIFLNPEPTVLK